LNDFTKIRFDVVEKNHNFVNNENLEIKNYGAIFMSIDDKNFILTNDVNYNRGKKVVELHFHNTLFEKG
jgi:hypothetical protein